MVVWLWPGTVRCAPIEAKERLEFAVAAKPRPASLANVTLTVGLLSTTVSLVPMKRSKKSVESTAVKTTNICPTCEDPQPVTTLTVCSRFPEAHGPFARDEMHKAVSVDGALRRVSSEAVAAAKRPVVPSRVIRLSVFPAEEVEAHTLPGGDNLYWLRPTDGVEFYGLLRDMVARDDLAFIGEVTVKDRTKLYRALRRGDGVVLVELARPDELHDTEAVSVELDARLAGQAQALVDVLVSKFVPEDWHDLAQQRLQELQDEPGTSDKAQVVPVAAGDIDGLLAGIRQLREDAA